MGNIPRKQVKMEQASGDRLPPVAVMQRMLDLQEKRLELDARQIDISEREIDSNRELGLKSMELNAQANTHYDDTMQRIMGWRYIFWAIVGTLATAAVVTALLLDKEAVVVEVVKYAAIFIGGYGTKSAVASRKQNTRLREETE